jgi:uncharacterized membrane protein YeaQ/YmgE (transglycosylase-associated protein family)
MQSTPYYGQETDIVKETIMVLNIIVWIIVGAIAGWLASLVMKTNRSQGLLEDVIVGIIGGFIGGFILNATGTPVPADGVSGLNLTSILVAFFGAVILLVVLRLLRGARI